MDDQSAAITPQPNAPQHEVLLLGQWTMELINALPENERFKKLIALDEQLPADLRAKWSVREVAEYVGWTRNTVNTMARMGYVKPDGVLEGERGDKFWYPATVFRYLLNRIEREQAKADKSR